MFLSISEKDAGDHVADQLVTVQSTEALLRRLGQLEDHRERGDEYPGGGWR
ncbi:hypothetical protein ACERK3_18565 [Phycisphaerales bacterium AB-hyl4]|uniref:Uncharacterized protein n=1 Tax=Natronomicrosphaera hydrolytica TaxID=3242702 RepID=A0ABV4UBL8_9BACT